LRGSSASWSPFFFGHSGFGIAKKLPARRNGGNKNREVVMKLEGGCYCGKVRYEAEGEPMMKAQCHCRECQYISGGAPNMFVLMPPDGFKYTKGTPKQFSRSDLEKPVTREFCAECGTHLITWPQAVPAVVVKVGTLDDPTLFGGPKIAIYTVDKQPFHHVPEGMPAFERLPGR
jgi:hypothetical protein